MSSTTWSSQPSERMSLLCFNVLYHNHSWRNGSLKRMCWQTSVATWILRECCKVTSIWTMVLTSNLCYTKEYSCFVHNCFLWIPYPPLRFFIRVSFFGLIVWRSAHWPKQTVPVSCGVEKGRCGFLICSRGHSFIIRFFCLFMCTAAVYYCKQRIRCDVGTC